MDYSTYTKPKMWANVIGAVLLYVLFAYELHSRLTGHYKGISYLLFLFLAVNCTYRVFAYATLKVKKTIQIVLGSVFLLSIFAYLILGKEWAKLPFSLSLCLICLYNLFFNNPASGAKKE